MRSSITNLAIFGLSAGQLAQAFPAGLSDAVVNGMLKEDQKRNVGDCPFAKRQAPGVRPPFDPALQYVSNTGEHAFRAPSSTDRRGPCPGLNAAANHGYLPSNGVGTITDFIEGCQAAFGMGADLATFLAIYGAIFDGDLTSYSIGGPSPSLPLVGGLLGQPQGLSGSHNKYESDVSPVYGDLYQYGDNELQLSQFKGLYELGQANGDRVDLDVLTKWRVQRFQQSVDENPYMFVAPFSGAVVSSAAYTFVYRFMANKTAEEPEGILDGETLKSFYGVTGTYPDFSHQKGHEKIPDNWYKRHPLDAYTIPYLTLDATTMQLQHPEFLSIGGNTGEVDSFTGVDPADLTGGVYNLQNLLEGNNLMCFAVQAALMMAPDILKPLFSNVGAAVSKLSGAVGSVTSELGCPEIGEFDDSQFSQFPGFTKLKSSGTY